MLALRLFESRFTPEIVGAPSPEWLCALLKPDAGEALGFTPPDDALRGAVRDLLRKGGFKPTGRSKPASEYLARAAVEPGLSSINAIVDLGNALSLHSGLPISVIDLDRATAPFSVRVADAGASYVFNASGQAIELAGLLCLFDANGPCANAVKDAQRTKTDASTRRTLSVIWGVETHASRVDAALARYKALSERLGAEVLEYAGVAKV